MQTFKVFCKIAKKHFAPCTLYFGIFLALMFLMTFFANDSNEKQYETYYLDVGIIDHDNSEASQSLTDYLDSVHSLIPMEDSAEAIQDSLYYNKVHYVVIIPEGFEKKLLDGETEHLIESCKQPDSANGFFVDEQINQYLKTLRLYLAGNPSIKEASAKTLASSENCSKVTNLSFEKNDHDAGTLMLYYFQYMPYILISVLILGLSPILVTFRNQNLNRRLECSALRRASKNIQLSLGCAAFSLILWLLFIIIARIAFGSDIFQKDGLLCILNSFVFLLVCVSIALLVSTFSPNSNVLNMISNVTALGMSFFCGIFVPQWMLSKQVLSVARFLPAYWYIQVTDRISGLSGEPFPMDYYWKCIGIQLLFAVALFIVYLIADKQKKQTS